MGQARALIVTVFAMTSPAAAQPEVAVPDHAVGDGRSVVLVTVKPAVEKPKAKLKELPVPEVATVTCTGASGLAALAKLPPGVLAPVVTKQSTLECVARVRDDEVKFRISVRPPGPGLYASASLFGVRSTTAEVVLDPFVWDGKTQAPPSSLRFAASDGRIAARADKLVLGLEGNAPRLIAIALADGDRLGAVFVPVTGVTKLPVESEAGASVQCWIAGRWFGPVRTTGRTATVPIEVPPGVTHGVARSTGRAGYVTDAITDLKIPPRPRIATVLASAAIHVNERSTIAIAIAGNDGRPGADTLSVRGTAQRGTLGAVTSRGGGLWSASYTAPAAAGPDRVTIQIDGGTGTLDIGVGAGGASRIAVEIADGPYAPGTEIAGTARVFDGNGNAVVGATVTATLAGVPLVMTAGDPIGFRGRIPERLPAGELAIELASGNARGRAPLRVHSVATTAGVRPVVDGRRATAELAVRDRFGNLVQDGAFDVQITGGRLEQMTRDQRAFRATVIADPGASGARLVIRAGGRVLADEQVRFDPPANAFVFGVWGSGGWVDNLGVLASPRGGVGLALRRGIGGIELALLVGAEGLVFRDTIDVMLGGMPQTATRSVTGLGLPSMLRARLRLSRRFGIGVGAGLVPVRAKVKLALEGQSADVYVETVIATRVQMHGDFRLGPGRVFLGAAYGRGALADGSVVGQIEGVALVGGYEWWFADFGW